VGGAGLHVEEEVEEEEEATEELQLEEFEYNGGTYLKDQNNLIYTQDFDLEVVGPIGEWNPKTNKIKMY
jgi:hypothetical protein